MKPEDKQKLHVIKEQLVTSTQAIRNVRARQSEADQRLLLEKDSELAKERKKLKVLKYRMSVRESTVRLTEAARIKYNLEIEAQLSTISAVERKIADIKAGYVHAEELKRLGTLTARQEVANIKKLLLEAMHYRDLANAKAARSLADDDTVGHAEALTALDRCREDINRLKRKLTYLTTPHRSKGMAIKNTSFLNKHTNQPGLASAPQSEEELTRAKAAFEKKVKNYPKSGHVRRNEYWQNPEQYINDFGPTNES